MAKKKYDDDDGRVIVNMNVDGMPWNNNAATFGDDPKKKDIEIADDLTKGEMRAIMGGAMKAALVLTLVFSIGGVLVVLGFLLWDDLLNWLRSIF